MEQPRRNWIHWSWYLLICGVLPGCNLQGGRFTSCQSWMGVRLINMALTFRTNQTPLLSLLSTHSELPLNRCQVGKFAVFALIEPTIHLHGRIIANSMV